MRLVERHADLPAEALSFAIALRVAAAHDVPSAALWWSDLAASPSAATTAAVAAEMQDALPRIPSLAPRDLPSDARVARLVGDLATPPTENLADLIGHSILGSTRQQQRSGQFFTPASLADMMAAMNPAQPGMYVADVACGAGALLLASHRDARARLGAAADTITYLGIDVDPRCARAAALVLWAHGAYEQSHVFCADTLTHAFAGVDAEGELRVLDMHVMLGNPPFGTRVTVPRGPIEPLIVPPEVLWRQWPRATLGDSQEVHAALDARRLLRGGAG